MAIKIGTDTIINDNGKLQHSPSLTVSHPTSGSTVITVSKGKLETFGGELFGFTSGGHPHPMAPITSSLTDIQKFPFSISGGVATDIGNLQDDRSFSTGHSSPSHGYTTGGRTSGSIEDNMEKFPLIMTIGTSSVTGDLTDALIDTAGHNTASHGYVSGGQTALPTGSPLVGLIQKFPFSLDNGNAVNVGELVTNRSAAGGHSSADHGYVSAGYKAPPTPTGLNTIERFPFAITSGSAASVGTINPASAGLQRHAAMSSETDGFTANGAQYGSSPSTQVKKFPFSSNASVSGVQSYTGFFNSTTGISSTTEGYFVGGLPTGPNDPASTTIRKFSFAFNTPVSTDVGDLASGAFYMSGHQY